MKKIQTKIDKILMEPKKTLESSHKWLRPSNKLRYAEGACDRDNDRRVMRWIILRTFLQFFIVVSNYGFAFTNQFSRCSAINFRANWDIAATLVITSHHITSHQGRQEGTKGLHHNKWCGQTCDLPSFGFDPFKQVKVLEERTHLMSDSSMMWNIKRLFY